MLSLAKWTKALLTWLVCISLVACGSDSNPQAESESGIQLPREVAQLRLSDGGSVVAYVQVDNGTKTEMTINGSTATLSLNLSEGSHQITISLEFIRSSDPTNPVILSESTKTVTINAGANDPLAFVASDFDFSAYDDDDDGFSNLSEMQSGSSAPVVESVFPASGSIDATTDSLITASFDDPINPTTLEGSVAVNGQQSGSVAGSISYDDSTHTVTFTPTNALTDGELYAVTIDTAVENTAGVSLTTMISWSFSVNDTAPAPSVLSVSPTDDSVDVAINSTIEATFDSSMDESTLSSGFTVTVTETSSAVDGTVTYDSTSLTATFTPNSPLNFSESYTASLSTGIQNTSGTALTAATSWSFTTADVTTYTVTVTAENNGSISPGSATVNEGDTTSFTVSPDAGYEINSVTGCNGSLTGTTYTTGTINADCTVSASFTALPTITIADTSVTEGNSGTATLSFTVSLSAQANGNVTVDYATSDGTATAGSDYTATSGTLTISSGTTSNTISVPVNGDTTAESAETLTLTLSNASSNATLGTATATGTILNDDATSYTVGGTVSGLIGSGLVLNNSGEDLSISANGSFTFPTALDDTNDYAVTVGSQPSSPNQICTVSNASGTLNGANVTNVSVVCVTNTYTVGGSVSGLNGSGLVLNNSGEDLSISANGSFTFPTALDDTNDYAVTVGSQPSSPNQICTVSNASGTLNGANIGNVAISCVNTYTIGVTVSGLSGIGLVLQNNNMDNLNVDADGSFGFATALADGSVYSVTLYSLPTDQKCSLENASGSINGGDVNIFVTCSEAIAPLAEVFPSYIPLFETTPITVQFSEAIDVNSLNISGSIADQVSSISWLTTSFQNDTLVLQSSSSWIVSPGNTLTIDVQDLAGNSLSEPLNPYGLLYFVSALANDNNGSGLLVTTAKQSIQAAIDASTAPATVLVSEGTYEVNSDTTGTPTNINLKEGIDLLGGFNSSFTARDRQVYVSEIVDISTEYKTGGLITSTMAEPAVNIPSGVTIDTDIDGFTIRGSANGSIRLSAGVYVRTNASVTITNNKIYGGLGSTSMTAIIILTPYNSNSYNSHVKNNLIIGGNSEFSIPSSSYGILVEGNSQSVLENNKITAWTGVATGSNNYSIFKNNLIYASGYGFIANGSSPQIFNNTIISQGYGIRSQNNADSIIENNIVTGSACIQVYTLGGTRAAIPFSLKNNDLFNCSTTTFTIDQDVCINNLDGDDNAQTCSIEEFESIDGEVAGWASGNIALDPLLTDTDGADNMIETISDNDWHLQTSSPNAVKFGGLELSETPFDFDDIIRTLNWSIGAFEQDL